MRLTLIRHEFVGSFTTVEEWIAWLDGRGFGQWQAIESFLAFAQKERARKRLPVGRYLKDAWDYFRDWLPTWNKETP